MKDQDLSIQPAKNGGYCLRTEMTVNLPIRTVFGFFSDAMQLQKITPPWLHFSVLTRPPICMKRGLLLDYRLYLHRIPISWRTEIKVWDPPYRFVDDQLWGPYKRWYHEHTFVDQNGSTLVQDNVHYIARGGALIHKFFVRPNLENIFRYRQETLAAIFEDMATQSIADSDSSIGVV